MEGESTLAADKTRLLLCPKLDAFASRRRGKDLGPSTLKLLGQHLQVLQGSGNHRLDMEVNVETESLWSNN